MSRNAGQLICPKCNESFTQDCLAMKPVCPHCGYTRKDRREPKFSMLEVSNGKAGTT